jgi:hypothetical protein
MVLGLLGNIPILNSFLGQKAPLKNDEDLEAATKADENSILKEGLKPLFIVVLPEGDFSELKTQLKKKFSGRDLHFEVDPEIKKPKLYIIKSNALAKRNSETALDKAFIKDNYKSIELSGDGNKLGESLFRTMNTEFIALEGAERKRVYIQKKAEKANLRQSLEILSKTEAKLGSPAERLKALGVNSCANGTCGHDHGKQLSEENIRSFSGALINTSHEEQQIGEEKSRNHEARVPINQLQSKRQKFESNKLTKIELLYLNTLYQKNLKRIAENNNQESIARLEKLNTAIQERLTGNKSVAVPGLDEIDSLIKEFLLTKTRRSLNLGKFIMSRNNSKLKTTTAPSKDKIMLQITQERKEDLKTFLIKLKELGNEHSKHEELIQSRNTAYIIHDRNKNDVFDPRELELTFAHRENTSCDFTIYRLPLINFLNGDKLTTSSERMTYKDIHEREMHCSDIVQTQYMLSLLKQLELKSNPTERDKIIENDFKSNLNKISDEIKASLKKIVAAAKRPFTQNSTTQRLMNSSILSESGNFSNVNFTQIDTKQSQEAHLAEESVNKSIKELLSNIFAQEYESFKISAKEVLSKFTSEETRQLNFHISQYFNKEINQSSSMIKPMGGNDLKNNLPKDKIENYINSRVKISQQLDLLPRLMNEGFSYENNLKGALEQSSPSSIHTNRQLAKTEHLQNTTNNSGKEKHDKQVGEIALTGQFSFIDRKEFHEKNKTYKDFPELPESWKTESNSPKTTTQETQTNHNPTPSEPVSLAEEENLERENTTQL